jgi:hypothetical protein
MSYIFEKLSLQDELIVSNKHFLYKYIEANTFLLNRNEDFTKEDPSLIVRKDNIRFVTIFAENNNLSSFFQVTQHHK